MEFNEEYLKDMKFFGRYFAIMNILGCITVIPTIFIYFGWLVTYTDKGIKGLTKFAGQMLIPTIIFTILSILFIFIDRYLKKQNKQLKKHYKLKLNEKVNYSSLANYFKNHKKLFQQYESSNISAFMLKENSLQSVMYQDYIIMKLTEYTSSSFEKEMKKLQENYDKNLKLKKYNFIYKTIFIFVDKWNQETEEYMDSFIKNKGNLFSYIIYDNHIFIHPVTISTEKRSSYATDKLVKKILDSIE